MKLQILIFALLFTCDFWAMEMSVFTRSLEFAAGYSARQGTRPTMEDAHVVLPSLDHNLALFAVYDGHGGPHVANFASKNLHLFMKENLIENPHKTRETILRDAFAKTEQRIIDEQFISGSTAVVALLENDSLYCAWVGDSRAILIRDGKVIAATEDHKPDKTRERERIEQAGGNIFKFGVWRIGECGLAVSRALGDQKAKSEKGGGGIIAEPEILQCTLKPDDVLLLACDGFWDIFSNDRAAKTLTDHFAKKISDLHNEYPPAFRPREMIQEGGDEQLLLISRALRDQAFHSGDNISVILVSIKEKITTP